VPLGAAAVVPPASADAPVALPVNAAADRATPVRRTPRRTIIVVLPENNSECPEMLAQRVPNAPEDTEVIVVCAGQPANLPAMQRTLGYAQLMLAPAGTIIEELRVLALAQASGDIVTLVSGAESQPNAVVDRGLARP